METIYDDTVPVLERIKFPMVWERLVCDVRVEDLQPARYDEALQITEKHFIEDDPMCKGCKLNKDEDSRREFLEIVLFWMQDTQSFVAVEESTGKAIGVLVGRVNYLDGHTKTMSRSRVRVKTLNLELGEMVLFWIQDTQSFVAVEIYQSDVLRKMQHFQSHINKEVDIFTIFNTEAYYKIHVWCVDSDYRDKGIGKALLRTAIEQTREFKIKIVMGVFTGAISQHIARKMGFQSQFEILYWQWKEDEEPVFDDPGAGNNSADLMVMTIELPGENKPEEVQPEQQKQENYCDEKISNA